MRRIALAVVGVAVLVAGIALTHDVSLAVPPAQAKAANDLMAGAGHRAAASSSFADEVATILAVQDRVLAAAPVNDEIPEGQPRELTDLIRARKGLCFDRSRAIETILRANGFEARHVAIYSTAETGSALKSLLSPGNESHAVTEVRTRKGWMLVDSNVQWIGLTRNGEPVAIADLRAPARRAWHAAVEDPLPAIYSRPFTFVYGLYSRHGEFYPPYNPVPDVNWTELAQNL